MPPCQAVAVALRLQHNSSGRPWARRRPGRRSSATALQNVRDGHVSRWRAPAPRVGRWWSKSDRPASTSRSSRTIGYSPRAPPSGGLVEGRAEIPDRRAAGCGVARPRAIARRRQCASCLTWAATLPACGRNLLRCGTGGWLIDPDRSSSRLDDPIDHGTARACAAGARHVGQRNCRARAGPGVAGRDTVFEVAGHDAERPWNQVFRRKLAGKTVPMRCMIVPADITEVSFPQAAHSQLARRRGSPHPCHGRRLGQGLTLDAARAVPCAAAPSSNRPLRDIDGGVSSALRRLT